MASNNRPGTTSDNEPSRDAGQRRPVSGTGGHGSRPVWAGWRPFAIGVAVAVMSVALWHGLRNREDAVIADTSRIVAESYAAEIESAVSALVLPLRRMAKQWEVRSDASEDELLADVASTDLSAFHAVEWVDATYQARWIVPPAGLDRDLSRDPRRRAAIDTARELGELTVSRAIDFLPGGRGFLFCAPLSVDGAFAGAILGVIMIDELLPNLERDAHALEIIDVGEQIHAPRVGTNGIDPTWIHEKSADLLGAPLTLRVWPTPTQVDRSLSHFPEVTLGLGFLAAILLALHVAASKQHGGLASPTVRLSLAWRLAKQALA